MMMMMMMILNSPVFILLYVIVITDTLENPQLTFSIGLLHLVECYLLNHNDMEDTSLIK